MAVNKMDDKTLKRLLSAIDQGRSEGRWRISTEALADALGVDMVELYRTVYDNPRGIDLGSAIEGFDQDRVGELVTLLEELGFRGAEDALFEAGLFVPLEAGNRLTEALLNRYVRQLRTHQVDWDRIAHELDKRKSYREVAGAYLREQLPVEPPAEAVVERFLREQGLPERGRETLLRHLRRLRERHVLDYAVLGSPFYEEVYRYAVAQGYIRPREREAYWAGRGGHRDYGDGKAPGSSEGKGSISWARSLLGVSAGAGKQAIRSAYRKEMLRYHPDVNPAGGEVAKELNAAYATLLADIEDSR
jgi:hypothetical protein